MVLFSESDPNENLESLISRQNAHDENAVEGSYVVFP